MGKGYSLNNQNGYTDKSVSFSFNNQNGKSVAEQYVEVGINNMNGVSADENVTYNLQNQNGVSDF